jgi:hypothetical protein
VDELREVDVNQLTPMEALLKLQAWKQRVDAE